MGNSLFSSSSNSSRNSRRNKTFKSTNNSNSNNSNNEVSENEDLNHTFPPTTTPDNVRYASIRRTFSHNTIRRIRIRPPIRINSQESGDSEDGVGDENGNGGNGLGGLFHRHSSKRVVKKINLDELEELSRETQLSRRTINQIHDEFVRVSRESRDRQASDHSDEKDDDDAVPVAPPSPAPSSSKVKKSSSQSVSVNKNEFLKLYSLLREESEEKIAEIANLTFDAIPKDPAGRVNFREFILRFAKITKGTIRQKLECTYEIYDMQRRGYVDKSDMKRVLRAMMPKMETSNPNDADTLARDCMNVLDPNKTGRISKFDFIEKLVDTYSLRSIMCPYN